MNVKIEDALVKLENVSGDLAMTVRVDIATLRFLLEELEHARWQVAELQKQGSQNKLTYRACQTAIVVLRKSAVHRHSATVGEIVAALDELEKAVDP